ncbi:phosphatidate cytidylyltransferase [Caloramator quimbayensis]|uniref:Phosphatidate cytidylyltransferase n=1 Tax=Caloramator quimbayensis TaxID=1147123 RepID=A0A1T4XBT4_9CLOT|nr:phosphatidate cytidylyltransferase [Caloramator quimbayensis]SKA87040.1 phosphatidate cytidylyltransferase [Caloramator quimbayensis]
MVDKRVISAVVAIPILIFCLFFGKIIFKSGIVFVSAICIYEYINAYKKSNHPVIEVILILGFILISISIFLKIIPNVILPIIYIVVISSMAAPIFFKKYNVVSSALTITGFIYIVCFFSLLTLIRDNAKGGSYLIWIVFIIAWSCDTAAYYSGRFFGKRKLCPSVSPKKTVEGSIGGIIGSVIGIIIWALISKSVITINWSSLILLGIIGGIVSQLGDLSASLIKRYVGIKDYGNIMPGHGGLLDRFDSILFTVPIVYYYITIFMG